MKKILNIILKICAAVSAAVYSYTRYNSNLVSDYFGDNTNIVVNDWSISIFFVTILLLLVNNWQTIRGKIKLDNKKTDPVRLISIIFPLLVISLIAWFYLNNLTDNVLEFQATSLLIKALGIFGLFILYFIVKTFYKKK